MDFKIRTVELDCKAIKLQIGYRWTGLSDDNNLDRAPTTARRGVPARTVSFSIVYGRLRHDRDASRRIRTYAYGLRVVQQLEAVGEIERYATIDVGVSKMLVGSKCGLVGKRAVSIEEAIASKFAQLAAASARPRWWSHRIGCRFVHGFGSEVMIYRVPRRSLRSRPRSSCCSCRSASDMSRHANVHNSAGLQLLSEMRKYCPSNQPGNHIRCTLSSPRAAVRTATTLGTSERGR